jgi:hypothetical protein
MADASHNDVVVDDVIDDYFIDSELVVQEGEYDLNVGTPGNPAHRTAFASAHALELAFWQPGSPWAPYDVQPVFTWLSPIGRYAFSTRGVPQAIEDMCLLFDTTIVEMDPLSFRSAPLHGSILGSVSTIERSQSRVVINDQTGVFAKKVHREAITCMPGGMFWLVKGLYTVAALTGTIGHLSYKNRQLTLFYGDFRRDLRLQPKTVVAHIPYLQR